MAGTRVLSQERLGHQDHEDSPLCNGHDVCPHFLCWKVYPNKEVWAEDPVEGNQAKMAFSSQVEMDAIIKGVGQFLQVTYAGAPQYRHVIGFRTLTQYQIPPVLIPCVKLSRIPW